MNEKQVHALGELIVACCALNIAASGLAAAKASTLHAEAGSNLLAALMDSIAEFTEQGDEARELMAEAKAALAGGR